MIPEVVFVQDVRASKNSVLYSKIIIYTSSLNWLLAKVPWKTKRLLVF